MLAQCTRSKCSLKGLHLANNRFSDDSRPENQYLHWIDLSGGSITREGAIALSRALCANTCLQELQPHQNNIGDDGAAALAHALDPNYSLLRLHLGNNGITEQCAHSSVAALARNMSAQQLWLDSNCLTGHGGLRLAHALQYAAALPPMPVCNVLITPLSFCSVLLPPMSLCNVLTQVQQLHRTDQRSPEEELLQSSR